MDLVEAHIRNAGYGGFSFRDLAAEIGIKSARDFVCDLCTQMAQPSGAPPFPHQGAMAAAVARRYGDRFLAESLGARMRAPEMPSPFTDWPSGRLSVARG